MPRPSSSTTIQRPDLGAIVYEYAMESAQQGFLADKILPAFDTALQSAEYPIIPVESFLKIQETKRAPRTNYNRSDYNFETGNYSCKDHGLEEPLDDTESAMYKRFFDAEEMAAKRNMFNILLAREKRIADKIFNATTFASQLTNVSTEWSTAATCTPRANVFAGKESMRAAYGIEPNALVMPKKIFNNLLLTAELRDALKYTNPIEIGAFEAQKRMMATYFGVDEILVGNAMYDSAKKGQSAVLADIWDDEYVGLVKISGGGMDLKEPVVGRTFLWTGDSPNMLTTEMYREEQKRCNIYRIRHNIDEAFIFTGAVWLLGNITA